mgnify:FL=1
MKTQGINSRQDQEVKSLIINKLKNGQKDVGLIPVIQKSFVFAFDA